MARSKSQQESKAAHEPGSLISANEAAKAIGKSLATAKRYKKILTEVWASALTEVVADGGMLTEKGLEELKKVAKQAAAGTPGQYKIDALLERPDLGHDPGSQMAHEPAQSLTSEPFEAELVEEGNLEPLSLVPLFRPEALDIASFRDNKLIQPTGLASVLNAVSGYVDGAIEAMDESLTQQEVQLRETKAHALALQKKRQQLDRKTLLYEAKTAALQGAMETAVGDLQQEVEAVQQGG